MPVPSRPSPLFQGLSQFWTRFFADADQVEALCEGSELLMGQAYLDLVSATLGVSLRDAAAFDKELYKLVTISEDEVSFREGASPSLDRWLSALPDNIVDLPSLDNKTFEPTASLERRIDFEVDAPDLVFVEDPTDTTGTGTPLPGYGRRTVDVETGGLFTDSTVLDWTPATRAGVMKGDVVRILDVGPGGLQRKHSDHVVVLVRKQGLYVSAATPLPARLANPVNFVVLRVPANSQVNSETFTLSISGQAQLAHTRIDQGSLRVFAQGPTGADVVEGVDFTFNYESGVIQRLTSWQGLPGPYSASYTWREEQFPGSGPSPRFSATGNIVSTTGTIASALQLAFWAPDALVDRQTLAANFGALIGRREASSEAYRSFLRGIFQLYILGPAMDRVESALNVVMGFPVVQDDGETFQTIDTSDPNIDRVLTTSPITGFTIFYDFPKGTPIRTDLVAGQSLSAFEVLTTAVTVTDYVQTPTWWANAVIPQALFTPTAGAFPTIARRTATPLYILNVVNPVDQAQVGDPGLVVGADEDGFNPTVNDGDSDTESPTHPVYRHRVAYVLMDRYMKYHSFFVTFDAAALSVLTGSAFPQSIDDLNNLVLASKPSHTYPFVVPSTFFSDVIEVDENPINFDRLVGSRIFGPDQVVFADATPVVGGGVWSVGDYWKYESFTPTVSFPAVGVPVTLPSAPAAPRHGYINRILVVGTIGGVALVENRDYTVDHTNRTVTRLTAWDATTVTVNFMQVDIGNLSNAPIGAGDMPLLVNGVDPALLSAAYDPAAAEWDGSSTPPTAPRDISLVERALVVYAH